MKAVVYKTTGPPSVLELVPNWPIPPKQPGQAKVAVKSTSYNPVDSKVRGGGRKVNLPKIPGGDLAGIVVEPGESGKFKVDDPVFALTPAFYGNDPNGTWAEFTTVAEEFLAPVPPNLSLQTEAGAVPLVSLTAFQALDSANLQPGSRVLVHAGSGGVGHFAVQLAKQHWGAYVVSTSRNVDFVKSLGADEVVDYTKEDFAAKYRDAPFDAIVDLVGGDTELKSYDVLKPGGTFAHIRNNGTDADRIEAGKKWVDKKYTVTFVQPNGEQLGIIAQLIADGKIKPHIDTVIPLEKAREAEDIAAKKRTGKIVIQI